MAKLFMATGADREGALSHLWRSPWTSWVGFRYLKSKKNSRFLSFITLISILGVALGVTAMIVVLSVMDGFEGELKKRLMSSDLHVLVSPAREVPGFDMGFVPKGALESSGIVDRLRSDVGVEVITSVVATEVILKAGRKIGGLMVKGVGPDRLDRLKAQLTEAAAPQMMVTRKGSETIRLPGLYIGQEFAYELRLMPGDEVTLISPTETEGPLNNVPRFKKYVIEGIYKSGTAEQELHTAFAAEATVRSFLRRTDAVSQWEITLKDFDRAPEVAAAIRAVSPGFRVQDWRQLNSHLFASLRLERVSMFVILAFIIVVASFNIVTTLTLMVLEKKREISIMKAMGARDGQVAAVFLAEGFFIGGVGVGSGVLAGFLICSLLRRYEFIQLPDIYYDRTLPVTFDPLYYALIAVCAVLIVIAACLYPSSRAARLNPIEGIRFG